MNIGYLPLITKGGGVVGEVFVWQSAFKIISDTLELFKEIDVTASDVLNDWRKSE